MPRRTRRSTDCWSSRSPPRGRFRRISARRVVRPRVRRRLARRFRSRLRGRRCDLTMVESKERKARFCGRRFGRSGLTDADVETERFEAMRGKPRCAGQRRSGHRPGRASRSRSSSRLPARLLKPGGRLLLFRPAHSPTPDPPGFKRVRHGSADRAAAELSVDLRASVPRGTKRVDVFHVEQPLTTIRASRILVARP